MKNKINPAQILMIVGFLVGCSSSTPQPVPIEPEDMCSYCRMAISSKQFAAEIIMQDEKIYKFDDAGCLLNFLDAKNPKFTALYVTDFNSVSWIPAESAFYVSTQKVSTPMSGGLLAFKLQNDASDAANKYEGQLLSFKQLPRKRS